MTWEMFLVQPQLLRSTYIQFVASINIIMCHVPQVEINTFIIVTTVHGMNLFPACVPVVICVCSRADRKVICVPHTCVSKHTTYNCTLVSCGTLIVHSYSRGLHMPLICRVALSTCLHWSTQLHFLMEQSLSSLSVSAHSYDKLLLFLQTGFLLRECQFPSIYL